MFVVFDLDGTLADDSHRAHLVAGPVSSRDYHRFYAMCVADKPRWVVVQTLKAHYLMRHRVEIWTGRSEEVRPQTEVWLDMHNVPSSLLTRMRPAGDSRPDVVLKREWLAEARANGGAPDVVYDDRDKVVAMWREEGVTCFQVAPGPF